MSAPHTPPVILIVPPDHPARAYLAAQLGAGVTLAEPGPAQCSVDCRRCHAADDAAFSSLVLELSSRLGWSCAALVLDASASSAQPEDSVLAAVGVLSLPSRQLSPSETVTALVAQGRPVLAHPLCLDERVLGWLLASADDAARAASSEQLASLRHALEVRWLRARLASREEELEKAHRATLSVEQQKAAFIQSLNQEFRAPLASMVGYAELALEQVPGGDLRDQLYAIQHDGLHLAGMFEDLLELSEIQSGTLELSEDSVDLRELCEQVMDYLQPAVGGKPVELLLDISAGVPGLVTADARRLRRVLEHLVGNGVKFTEKGHVLLTVMESPTANPAPGKVALEFSLQDTGIGIPQERLGTLFQAFGSVDNSASRRHGGLGLGLALSQPLVELMGGSITVESEVGVGSRFCVNLDLPATSPAGLPPSPEQACLGRGLVVAVANPLLAAMIERDCALAGIEVTLVGSPQEASSVAPGLSRLSWALVDTDAFSRPIQGWQIQRGDGTAVKVISLGVSAPPAGHGVHLPKPYRAKQLFSALASALPRAGVVPSPGAALGQGLRVLIVDDDRVNLKVFSTMLRRLGHQPDIADCGMAAIEKTQAAVYDLVLMDLRMPEIDGWQATELIRSTLPPARVPRIVALTADVINATREKCHEMGMHGFLQKPLDSTALKRLLAETPRLPA